MAVFHSYTYLPLLGKYAIISSDFKHPCNKDNRIKS